MNEKPQDQAAQPPFVLPMTRWDWISLASIAGIWMVLGLTVLFVGPSEKDDVLYTDLAVRGSYYWEVQHRYIHIWLIRLFYLASGSLGIGAGTYAVTVVVGTAVAGFFVARRIGGRSCAIASGLLIPTYPGLIKFMSVPYVDPAVTLWSLSCLWGVMVCMAPARPRHLLVGALWSGCCAYFAMKCKETGLAVLPAVALGLWYSRDRLRVLGFWLGGVAIGWLTLVGLDAAFSTSSSWSSMDPPFYRTRPPAPAAVPGQSPSPATKTPYKMGYDFIHLLLLNSFMGWTLTGTAGAVRGVKPRAEVRVLVVWFLSTLLFETLISGHYKSIQASTRYTAALGPPLVILGVYWVAQRLQEAVLPEARRFTLTMAGTLMAVCALPLGLSSMQLFTKLSPPQASMFFFVLPVALVIAFATALVTSRRWLVAASVAVLMVLSLNIVWHETRDYTVQSRARMINWARLVHKLENNGAGIARWNTRSYPFSVYTVLRRWRTVSANPENRPPVRTIKKLEELGPNEWVFTTGYKNARLQDDGFTRVAKGKFRNTKAGRWSVWRPPDNYPPAPEPEGKKEQTPPTPSTAPPILPPNQ